MGRNIGLAYRKTTNKMGNMRARIGVEIQGPNRMILKSFMVRTHNWRKRRDIGKLEGINKRFSVGIECERNRGARSLLYVLLMNGCLANKSTPRLFYSYGTSCHSHSSVLGSPCQPSNYYHHSHDINLNLRLELSSCR